LPAIAVWPLTRRGQQGFNLVFRHDAPSAFGQLTQLKIADADSYQAQDCNIEGA
jgi:hypothetical protein